MTSTTRDTAPTMILDMDVRPTANKAGFAWEVFNAQTGTAYARGIQHTVEAAELAAAKAITRRTLYVRKVEGQWHTAHPQFGLIPLPLTPEATEDMALAHLRALPIARNYQVVAA
jgi:hypothetical protein